MMIRLAADENFSRKILRGLRGRVPGLDAQHAKDIMPGAADEEILEWAASEGRILLTHDVNTLLALAYRRIDAGMAMPGVIVVRNDAPVGRAVRDLELIAICGRDADFDCKVEYLPL